MYIYFNYIYIYIYIYIYTKLSPPSAVEDDPKSPFSIATNRMS